MGSHTESQRYLSTRGGSYDFSFEDVVLKGLASDGGLFIPEEIPTLPADWKTRWATYSFQELAFAIFSLYISPSEIPPDDLKDIVHRSYATFRSSDVTPVVTLDKTKNLHLLELFHGPTFAFKDVALQFLGNLFEYFLVRKNKTGKDRSHLTVIGATSGDTGSAAIYGLRGKKDVSVFIMHPKGKVSPVQEAQMTTVLDPNVHNLAVSGTFDDCQDFVKALFADPEINATHRLAAVNSINWARILAQISYYFASYFALVRSLESTENDSTKIRFVVPTGNFGDILAGYFAKRMGLPVDKLVIATNENDILHRFWQSGHYEKKPVHGRAAEGGLPEDGVRAHEDGVKETLSPAMDILVSSNFERLLWYLAYLTNETGATVERRKAAGAKVQAWLDQLKQDGGFGVNDEILRAAKADFESERVSDHQTVDTIKLIYSTTSNPKNLGTRAGETKGTLLGGRYVLDPHSAIGIAASLRSGARTGGKIHHISLATAHPAKFAGAVQKALESENGFHFSEVLPDEFEGLEQKERRVIVVKEGAKMEDVREIVRTQVSKELQSARTN
ncbi:Threonine synthase-like protein [Elsinoe fawcettii]|nr:Threonine synthase-like protein [Elsinoe fawcettii]